MALQHWHKRPGESEVSNNNQPGIVRLKEQLGDPRTQEPERPNSRKGQDPVSRSRMIWTNYALNRASGDTATAKSFTNPAVGRKGR